MEAEARKAELQKLQKSKKDWTPEMQTELEEVTLFLVDLDEIVEAKEVARKEAEERAAKEYIPEPGTEGCVHALIREGSAKFDSKTGEKIKPFKVLYSYSEWQVFQKNAERLGYHIEQVLHNPFSK